jgi:hypothetical protein
MTLDDIRAGVVSFILTMHVCARTTTNMWETYSLMHSGCHNNSYPNKNNFNVNCELKFVFLYLFMIFTMSCKVLWPLSPDNLWLVCRDIGQKSLVLLCLQKVYTHSNNLYFEIFETYCKIIYIIIWTKPYNFKEYQHTKISRFTWKLELYFQNI